MRVIKLTTIISIVIFLTCLNLISVQAGSDFFFGLKTSSKLNTNNTYDIKASWNQQNFTTPEGKFKISIHAVNQSSPVRLPPDGQHDGGIVPGGEEKTLNFDSLESIFLNVDFTHANFGQYITLSYFPSANQPAKYTQTIFFGLDDSQLPKKCTLMRTIQAKEILPIDGGYENATYYITVNLKYIYITDVGHHQIFRYSIKDNSVLKWGSYGTQHGQFKYPRGIALDQSGNVYVSDMHNHRIEMFNQDGQYLKTVQSSGKPEDSLRYPTGITIDKNNFLFVLDAGHSAVRKYNTSGNLVTSWKSIDQNFPNLYSITSDREGQIYVGDINNDRIYKFNSNLQPITSFGNPFGFGQHNDSVAHPVSLTIDNDNLLYVSVADKFIKSFTNAGRYSGTLSFKGMALGFNEYDNLLYSYYNQKIETYLCIKIPNQLQSADSNLDGVVDGLDYVTWLHYYDYSLRGQRYGDFNEDNHIDGVDYVIWLNQFSQ